MEAVFFSSSVLPNFMPEKSSCIRQPVNKNRTWIKEAYQRKNNYN